MSNPTIISLSVLQVNWDRGQDYLGSFLPFLVECLKDAPAREVSLPDIQQRMLSIFGLRLPAHTVKLLLNRAIRQGFIKKRYGILLRVDDKLPQTKFKTRRDKALRELVALVEAFQHFCQEKFDKVLEFEEAESALHEYLASHIDSMLAATLNGSPVPEPNRRIKGAHYLTNAFIRDILEKSPDLFAYLETLVKGTFLANSLLYQDFTEIGQDFKNIEVYFDTTFLLAALGLTGDQQRIPCQELLDLLQVEGARLCCFDHTLKEIQRILDTSSFLLRTGKARRAYGETNRFFFENRWTSSDVERVISELPSRLGTLRIQVIPHPEYAPQYGVNEQKLLEDLKAGVGYNNSESEAPQMDAASLTGIYRLREGGTFRELESCRAIFATPNTSLVRVAMAFFNRESGVPVAITDAALTYLVWLKRPTAAPELPKKRVIANCFAAMEPPDPLWKLYLDKVDELEQEGALPPDSFALLRYSMEAKVTLMDLTLGEAGAFTEGTVEEVLKVARENVRREALEQVEEQRRQRESVQETLARSEERYQQTMKNVQVMAQGAARAMSTVLFVLIGIVLATGAYLSWRLPSLDGLPLWRRFILLLLPVVFLIGGVASLLWGITAKGLGALLESWLATKIEVFFWRRLGGAEAKSTGSEGAG